MKRMLWAGKKIAIVALIVIVGGYGAMEFIRYRLNDKTEEPEVLRPVRTLVLEKSEGTFRGTYQGTVQASQKVDLSFRVSGPLIDLPVKKGQDVKKGTLLARVDPRDFKTSLDSATSQLKQLEAKLAQMKSGARAEDISSYQASVNAAQAQSAEAQANYKRYKGLYDQGAVSQVQYEQYKTAANVASANLRSAKEALKKGRKGARQEELDQQSAIIAAQSAAVEAAQSALNDTKLYAPFDGVIADKFVDNHQFVQAKQNILSLQNLKNIEMIIHVPDSDVVRTQKGLLSNLAMVATLDSLPGRSFPVEFKEFSTQADPQTQTYQATVIMPFQKDVTILPGMAVTVTVTGKTLSEKQQDNLSGFYVPVDAVFGDEQGHSFVWVSKDDKVNKVEVTTGDYRGGDIKISSSEIKNGDIVVTAGVHFLKEGQKVRLMKKQ